VASQSVVVVVSAGGGVCVTSGATDAITLTNVASRVVGVAPLAVFFDATGTSAGATSRPFHELEYSWNFGDPAGGAVWAYGAQAAASRNMAKGPVAAHVFETPGVYTVTLGITDGVNTVSNSCSQIVVQNPDTEFAGADTVCVAANSLPVAGAGGCPAGAATAQQPSFPAAIASYAKSGKRVLLRRGDAFSAATPGVLANVGPGLIGAYGSGAKPVISSTGNAAILQLSSPATPTVQDWRIMDLDLDGMSGTTSMGIRSYGTMQQTTLLRLAIHDVQTGIQLDGSTLDWFNSHGNPGHTIWDQFALVDSTIRHIVTDAGYGFFGAGNRLAVLGTQIDDSLGSTHGHIARFTYLTKAVISNNTFSNQGPFNALIKMHGPPWVNATTPPTGTGVGGYTEKVIISDNKLAGTGTWSVNVGPENGQSDERLRDVIAERNWFTASAGVAAELVINGVDITARNNIFDMSNAGVGDRGIRIALRAPGSLEPPPLRVSILNNTFYTSTAGLTAVSIEASATNTTVKNNLGYAPSASSPALLSDEGSKGLVASNNSSNAQLKSVSPVLRGAPPIVPADYRPAAGSYAVGGGVVVPVWSDFGLMPQTANRDMGAMLH
jgi:hypothetical protein